MRTRLTPMPTVPTAPPTRCQLAARRLDLVPVRDVLRHSARREVRNEPLALEELTGLLEREVGRRHDHIGRRQLGVVERLALVAHSPGQLLELRSEALLVACLEQFDGRIVELVQSLGRLVGEPELALAHQPRDHRSSSFCFSPVPSSAFILASSSSTCDVEATCASSRSSCDWSPAVKSSSVPEATSSSTADARACICSVLSFARWMASPVSAICSPIPLAASPICTCASAAEYCALITSFWLRKASTLAESCFSLATSLSCWASRSFDWRSRSWSCCCTTVFRSSA